MKLITEAKQALTNYRKLNKNIKPEEPPAILFIDLKSAFDSCNHPILMDKIDKYKFNTDWINTIKMLYQTTGISTNGHNHINVKKGVI